MGWMRVSPARYENTAADPNVAKTQGVDHPPTWPHCPLGGPAPLLKSGLVPAPFPTAFRTSLWPPPRPPRRPLDTKRVSQASFWTPFGNRFGSKLAIVAPCENLIIYNVFITKTLFGPGRVPNKTPTCIHIVMPLTPRFVHFFLRSGGLGARQV